jgi:hypothetical protein
MRRYLRWAIGLAIPCAALVVGACVGDSGTSTPDAGGQAAQSSSDVGVDVAPTDAGADAATQCDVAKPFGSPQPVAGLESALSARLSPDYLTAYFSVAEEAGIRAYSATRNSTSSAFGSRTAVLPSTLVRDPTVTGDGLSMLFWGNGADDVWLATRSSPDASFANPVAVSGVNTAGEEAYPFVREDGKILYHTSPNGLARSTNGGGGFATPTTITELKLGGINWYPAVTPDDLVIYWAANVPDAGAGAFDVWVATRASVNDVFSGAHAVTELNTAATEKPNFITRDRCSLYFARGGVVMVATKTP